MKIEHKKIMIPLLGLIIICIIVIFLVYLQKESETAPGLPEITLLETASSVSIDPNTYVPESFFKIGDTVWIYMEYENITHQGVSNFTILLNVTNLDGEILYSAESNITKNEKACFYYFDTNESWSADLHIVSSKLIDNISGQIAVKSTFFNLA